MTRRGILGAVGKSLILCAAPLVQGTAAAGSPGSAEEKPYDLLIKGGKVIDPSQGVEAELDVAVRDGKVASVAPGIPEGRTREVLRADGKIVTPGLIDLHAHVFPYVGPYGIEPDPYCVRRGVTSVIDAGTSGAFTFPGLSPLHYRTRGHSHSRSLARGLHRHGGGQHAQHGRARRPALLRPEACR